MATELAGTQITTLMEALPGIAQVLRSPVADAVVTLVRAASRHPDFVPADAEELLRYAVRRNLMGQDECDRLIAEARAVVQRRAERAASQRHPHKSARPRAKVRSKAKAKRQKRRR